MRIFSLILCFVFLNQMTWAQTKKNIDHQSLTWIRYYNILTITEKWGLHSEIDNRNFTNPICQNVFLLRVQGRYRANKKIDLGGGFAYFNTNTQNPNNNPDYSVPEYRLQQDVTFINDIAKITFNNRFQVEERFIQKANAVELLNDYSYAWRFRYRLQSTFTLWEKEKEKQNLKGTISDEVMFNLGNDNTKNTFDQNRIYGALRYAFNPNIHLELGYLKNFQKRASGVDFYDRDIIRFTVYHKINRKNKT